MIEWFSINPHLIPSVIIFVAGGVVSVSASVMYHVRKKKVMVISPIKVIGGYSGLEKRIFLSGIVLAALGLISLIAISELHGYYYFNNGLPIFSGR